jgi:hypothetical protein
MRRLAKFAFLLIAVAVVAHFAMRSSWLTPLSLNDLPALSVAECGAEGEAGHVDRLTGSMKIAETKASVDAKKGKTFPVASRFQLPAGSSAELFTEGNWKVELEGEGSFRIDDARTDSTRTRHTSSWFVEKGTFLAHPREFDPSEHWMEIRTPIARVLVRNAELGMKISQGGGGQVWIQSGNGVVLWNDGRKKELKVKGMEFI